MPEETITKPLRFHKRREEIKLIIEQLGLWNIQKKQLAERYGVSRQAIHNDINQIIKHAPVGEIKEIAFELSNAYKKALNESRKILHSSDDPKMKLMAADTISRIGKEFTSMLESYGLKEKIAERLDVEMKERYESWFVEKPMVQIVKKSRP